MRATLPQFFRYNRGDLIILVADDAFRRRVVSALRALAVLRLIVPAPSPFALIYRVTEDVTDGALLPPVAGRVRDAARVEVGRDSFLRRAARVKREDFEDDGRSLFEIFTLY